MKKITKILLSCFMLLIFTVPAHAISGVDYGKNYTLNGTLTNTYITGSATGANSSNVNVDLEDAKYFNGRQTITASSISAMTYITYYGTSLEKFERWKSVDIYGTLSSDSHVTHIHLSVN